MRMGRFVIDTHVHGQRVAVNFQDREEKPDYATLSRLMWNAEDADQADDDADEQQIQSQQADIDRLSEDCLVIQEVKLNQLTTVPFARSGYIGAHTE